MKIKFNSEDDLHLKKTLKLRNIIVVMAVFYKDNKYYLQVFLDHCFYKLSMLYFDRIDVSEGTDQKSASKKCDICHY